MSTDWQEAGQTVEIEHHSELLARHQDAAARIPSRRAKRWSITIPVISAAIAAFMTNRATCSARSVDVLEAPRNREKSFCCGAGGGQMFLGEEKGKRINIARAEELVATGATTVAAACPFCASMFRDALKAVSDSRRSCWISRRLWRRRCLTHESRSHPSGPRSAVSHYDFLFKPRKPRACAS